MNSPSSSQKKKLENSTICKHPQILQCELAQILHLTTLQIHQTTMLTKITEQEAKLSSPSDISTLISQDTTRSRQWIDVVVAGRAEGAGQRFTLVSSVHLNSAWY
jgi:hypothetical protein